MGAPSLAEDAEERREDGRGSSFVGPAGGITYAPAIRSTDCLVQPSTASALRHERTSQEFGQACQRISDAAMSFRKRLRRWSGNRDWRNTIGRAAACDAALKTSRAQPAEFWQEVLEVAARLQALNSSISSCAASLGQAWEELAELRDRYPYWCPTQDQQDAEQGVARLLDVAGQIQRYKWQFDGLASHHRWSR